MKSVLKKKIIHLFYKSSTARAINSPFNISVQMSSLKFIIHNDIISYHVIIFTDKSKFKKVTLYNTLGRYRCIMYTLE